MTARLKLWIPAILTIAGLLFAVWGSWLNVRAERRSPGLAQPDDPPAAPADVDLPAFEPVTAKNAVVSRRAEPRTDIRQRARIEVLRYTVQDGDSVFGIADRFAIDQLFYF